MSSMNAGSASDQLAKDFVAFSVRAGLLRVGEFKNKAGRLKQYFFNSGLFYDGANLARAGDVVVVTVNHRLNVFGYLELAEQLGAE